MKKTLKIEHPTAEKILELDELQEIEFRIGEHLQELWEKYDKFAGDNERVYIAKTFGDIINNSQIQAWKIRNLKNFLGPMPF